MISQRVSDVEGRFWLDVADGFTQVARMAHILKVRQVFQLAEVDTCIRIPHGNDVKLKVLATTFSSVNAKRQCTVGRCGRGVGPQHLTTRTSPTNCVFSLDDRAPAQTTRDQAPEAAPLLH